MRTFWLQQAWQNDLQVAPVMDMQVLVDLLDAKVSAKMEEIAKAAA